MAELPKTPPRAGHLSRRARPILAAAALLTIAWASCGAPTEALAQTPSQTLTYRLGPTDFSYFRAERLTGGGLRQCEWQMQPVTWTLAIEALSATSATVRIDFPGSNVAEELTFSNGPCPDNAAAPAFREIVTIPYDSARGLYFGEVNDTVYTVAAQCAFPTSCGLVDAHIVSRIIHPFEDDIYSETTTWTGRCSSCQPAPAPPQLRIDIVKPDQANYLEPFVPASNGSTRNKDRNRVELRVGCYEGTVNVPCSWTIAAERFPANGNLAADTGHPGTHSGTPSAGSFTREACNASIEPPCLAQTTTYLAGQVSGTVRLVATCTGGSCQQGAPLVLRAEIRALQDARATAGLWIKEDDRHGREASFVKPEVHEKLRRIADCWRGVQQCLAPLVHPPMRAGVSDRLFITDLALRYGGKHDIPGQWEAIPARHFAHHEGKTIDLRIYRTLDPSSETSPRHPTDIFTAVEQTYLEALFKAEGFVFANNGEKPGNAIDHWHAYYRRPVTARPGVIAANATSATFDAVRTPARAAACSEALSLVSDVTFDGARNIYRYAYTAANVGGATSLESLALDVITPATSPDLPGGWVFVDSRTQPGDSGVSWVGVGGTALQGGQVVAFVLESPAPPGLVTYDASFGAASQASAIDDAVDDIDPCATVTGLIQGPVVQQAQFLAEGATGTFFETRFALLNPYPWPTTATMTFFTDTSETVTRIVDLPANGRRTVVANTIAGLASANFSTQVESAGLVIVERTISWGGGYGSHAEAAVPAPSTTWYLAEGSTSGEFALFYLLQNPNASAVSATVRYLRPLGFPPIEKTYVLPPHSRTTIGVDGEGAELASTDVSAVISTTAPIVAERAMYRSTPAQVFAAGHGSAGVTAPSTRWFLAEGATGPFFDLFILLANPTETAAEVRVDYLLSTGQTLTKTYGVAANGRVTIWVDDEQIPEGSGARPLANVAVSSTITSTNDVPIIVERTMWWPGPEVTANYWTEAHNSPGATVTGTRWALAEGEVGGDTDAETYILIANTSASAGQARVTLFFEDGGTAERAVMLLPTSRTNVNVRADIPESNGRRFGAIVESLGDHPAQIVVERAMYASPGGQTWTAGTNALGTRLP